MAKAPSTLWTSGMTPEQKIQFLGMLTNNTQLINRFLTIVNSWEEEIKSLEINPSNFEKPEFMARQAFYLGQKQAYDKVKVLFDFIANP